MWLCGFTAWNVTHSTLLTDFRERKKNWQQISCQNSENKPGNLKWDELKKLKNIFSTSWLNANKVNRKYCNNNKTIVLKVHRYDKTGETLWKHWVFKTTANHLNNSVTKPASVPFCTKIRICLLQIRCYIYAKVFIYTCSTNIVIFLIKTKPHSLHSSLLYAPMLTQLAKAIFQ